MRGSLVCAALRTEAHILCRHTSAHKKGIHECEQVQHTLTQMPHCTRADTLQPFYLRAQLSPQARSQVTCFPSCECKVYSYAPKRAEIGRRLFSQ